MDPNDVVLISPAGIVMIVVLATCFVMLVGLVATWPPIANRIRQLLHLGGALPSSPSIASKPPLSSTH